MLGQPRQRLRRALARPARRMGFDLLDRSFYSPIPDVDALPADLWDGPRPTPGIDLRTDEQLRHLEQDLAPYVAEFTPPRASAGFGEYFLDNGAYDSVDAEVLYATVRHGKPRRILEVGSGFSTLVTAQAVLANRREGHACEFVASDPYPRDFLQQPVEGLDAMRAWGAADVPAAKIATTHTVKTGGDVNHWILDVFPTLAPGVLVHVHDIFLPWEYPRPWLTEMEFFWAEQYLLQAFLALNRDFEVILAAHHLARAFPERVGAVVPSFAPGVLPGAFWMRRVAAADGQGPDR
jgi:hypothetical protein